MQDILQKIIESKKKEIVRLMIEKPVSDLRKMINTGIYDKRDFKGAISKKGYMNIIAELKKASPSKGMLNEKLNIIHHARQYEEGGASAISVLTEIEYFKGHPDYLGAVKSKVKIPILRKDFLLSEYQIYESKVLGADAILLIAGILDLEELGNLYDLAKHLRLDVLFEVHNEDELDKVLRIEGDIIGINNRSLNDFSVDINVTQRLIKLIPKNKIIVSESGIQSRKDVMFLDNLGVNAVLIGEYLVKSQFPKDKIQELKGVFC